MFFSLPKARTNYGKFSIRFAGNQIWNLVDESITKTTSISNFKIQNTNETICMYIYIVYDMIVYIY